MRSSKPTYATLCNFSNVVGFVHKSLFAICKVYRHVEKEIETLAYPSATFFPRVVWIVHTEEATKVLRFSNEPRRFEGHILAMYETLGPLC